MGGPTARRGPTRRRLLAAAGAASATGLAGCSLLRSDACESVREQVRLLAEEDYGAATKFVPHERLSDTSRADARELMAFRGELLFPADATLRGVNCVCRQRLDESGRSQLRALMDRSPVAAPSGELTEAVYIRYEVQADLGTRTERDTYSDVLYHVAGEGPFVAFISGSQKARLPVEDCRPDS